MFYFMKTHSLKGNGLIWANLLHLSYNMWEDYIAREIPDRGYRPYLRFDEDLWHELTERMADAGMNMVIIDLGDGVKYASHPNISVEGAWSRKKLSKEINRLRKLGLEPIPKLNFSTCHDAWMGIYSRCVSTPLYYQVCHDLIREVAELFDRPRFFHLGMDEETFNNQKYYRYLVIRQFDLWWHDLYFLVKEVQKTGSRPWVWSDYMWAHGEEYLKKMPKSVVQSNWYYRVEFTKENNRVKAYHDLESRKFDQVPTGSNWAVPTNFEKTVEYCRKHIHPKRLLGFMQTPWAPTVRARRKHHLEAIEQVATVISS